MRFQPLLSSLAVTLLLAPPALSAAGLSRQERAVIENVRADMPRTLALLEKAVNIESATQNTAGVRAVGKLFTDELEPLGFRTSWVDVPPEVQRAGHLFAQIQGT